MDNEEDMKVLRRETWEKKRMRKVKRAIKLERCRKGDIIKGGVEEMWEDI